MSGRVVIRDRGRAGALGLGTCMPWEEGERYCKVDSDQGTTAHPRPIVMTRYLGSITRALTEKKEKMEPYKMLI